MPENDYEILKPKSLMQTERNTAAGEKMVHTLEIPEYEVLKPETRIIAAPPQEEGILTKMRNFFTDPAKEEARATQALVDSTMFGVSPSVAYSYKQSIDRMATTDIKQRRSDIETALKRVNAGEEEASWMEAAIALTKTVPLRIQSAAGGILRSIEESTDNNLQIEGAMKWINWLGSVMGTDKGTLQALQVATDVIKSDLEKKRMPTMGAAIQKAAMTKLEGFEPFLVPGTLKSYAYQAADTGLLNVAYLLPSLVTKNPAYALGLMGLQSAGEQYGAQREGGSDIYTATLASLGYGALEAGSEFIPVGIYLKPSAGFIKRLLEAEFAEISTELVNQWGQQLIDKVTLRKDMTLGQAIQETIDTAIVTALVTPALAGIAEIHGAIFKRVNAEETSNIAGTKLEDTKSTDAEKQAAVKTILRGHDKQPGQDPKPEASIGNHPINPQVRAYFSELIDRAIAGDLAARSQLEKFALEEHGSGIMNGIGYSMIPLAPGEYRVARTWGDEFEATWEGDHIFFDLDNMHDLNKMLGYDRTNEILKNIGELMAQYKDEQIPIDELGERMRQDLSEMKIEFEDPNGVTHIQEGIGISYGYGKTREEAKNNLKADKRERAIRGERRERATDIGRSIQEPTEREPTQKDRDTVTKEISDQEIDNILAKDTSIEQDWQRLVEGTRADVAEEREGEGFGIDRQNFEDFLERSWAAVSEYYSSITVEDLEEGEKLWKNWRDYYREQDLHVLRLELMSSEHYNRYIGRLPEFEQISVEDIVEAWRKGILPETSALETKTPRIDIREINAPRLNVPFEPQPRVIMTPEVAKATWEIAKQRRDWRETEKQDRITAARASMIIQNHLNPNLDKDLGITRGELSKQMRGWIVYRAESINIHQVVNEGKPDIAQWDGILNSQWYIKKSVPISDISRLVKDIEVEDRTFYAPTAEGLRNMIMRTLLAIDSRLSYTDLTFVIKSTINPNGLYDVSKNTIYIKQNSPHTVAHEIFHYLDWKWGREFGWNIALSDQIDLPDEAFKLGRISKERYQWFKRFDEFITKLSRNAYLGTEYYARRVEIFARFGSDFVQWVNELAGQRLDRHPRYNEKFTKSHFMEFIRLLQEKAYVDIIDGNPLGIEAPGQSADIAESRRPRNTRIERDRIEPFFIEDYSTITKAQWEKVSNYMKRMGYDWRGAEDAEILMRNLARDGNKQLTGDHAEAMRYALDLIRTPEQKRNDRIVSTAVRYFGKTLDPNEAGYITPTGTMIDFSGKREGGTPGTRSYDHRQIGFAFEGKESLIEEMDQEIQKYEESRYMVSNPNMPRFMATGSMRIDWRAGTIEMVKAPTVPQRRLIAKMMQDHGTDGIYIDMANLATGARIPIATSHMRPWQVFKFINDFYNTGDTAESRVDEPADAFFSKLRKVIHEYMPGRTTKEGIFRLLQNRGVKQDEIRWSFLEEYLSAVPDDALIPKSEIIRHLESVDLEIKEYVYGPPEPSTLGEGNETLPDLNKLLEAEFDIKDRIVTKVIPAVKNEMIMILDYDMIISSEIKGYDEEERDYYYQTISSASKRWYDHVIVSGEYTRTPESIAWGKNGKLLKDIYEMEMQKAQRKSKSDEVIDWRTFRLPKGHPLEDIGIVDQTAEEWFTENDFLLAQEYIQWMKAADAYQAAQGSHHGGERDTKYSKYMEPGASADEYREITFWLPSKDITIYPYTKESRNVRDQIRLESTEPTSTGQRNVSVWRDIWGEEPILLYKRVNTRATDEELIEEAVGDINDGEKGIAPIKRAIPAFGKDFATGHWDERNIFAHVRFSDRTTQFFKKMLFIEEIQSDYANEARQKKIVNEETESDWKPQELEPWYNNFDLTVRLGWSQSKEWVRNFFNQDQIPQHEISKRTKTIEGKEVVRYIEAPKVTDTKELENRAFSDAPEPAITFYQKFLASMQNPRGVWWYRAPIGVESRNLVELERSPAILQIDEEFKDVYSNGELFFWYDMEEDTYIQAATMEEAKKEFYATVKNRIFASLEEDQIADAPFIRGSWMGYVIKRMIRWAAANGYDGIGWTTGEMQARRWAGAMQQFTEIEWNADTNTLVGWRREGNPIYETVTEQQLPAYIGADIAAVVIRRAQGLEQEPGEVSQVSLAAIRQMQLTHEPAPMFYNKHTNDWRWREKEYVPDVGYDFIRAIHYDKAHKIERDLPAPDEIKRWAVSFRTGVDEYGKEIYQDFEFTASASHEYRVYEYKYKEGSTWKTAHLIADFVRSFDEALKYIYIHSRSAERRGRVTSAEMGQIILAGGKRLRLTYDKFLPEEITKALKPFGAVERVVDTVGRRRADLAAIAMRDLDPKAEYMPSSGVPTGIPERETALRSFYGDASVDAYINSYLLYDRANNKYVQDEYTSVSPGQSRFQWTDDYRLAFRYKSAKEIIPLIDEITKEQAINNIPAIIINDKVIEGAMYRGFELFTNPFFDPGYIYHEMKQLTGDIQEAIPYLTRLGRRVWEEGSRTYASFHKAMKSYLKDLWIKFRGLIRQVFDGLKRFNDWIGEGGQLELYHGSPHRFERFSTDKIGTGEGAQAFGWGLYFTEAKEVAEHYKKDVLRRYFEYNGEDLQYNDAGVQKVLADLEANGLKWDDKYDTMSNDPKVPALSRAIASMRDPLHLTYTTLQYLNSGYWMDKSKPFVDSHRFHSTPFIDGSEMDEACISWIQSGWSRVDSRDWYIVRPDGGQRYYPNQTVEENTGLFEVNDLLYFQNPSMFTAEEAVTRVKNDIIKSIQTLKEDTVPRMRDLLLKAIEEHGGAHQITETFQNELAGAEYRLKQKQAALIVIEKWGKNARLGAGAGAVYQVLVHQGKSTNEYDYLEWDEQPYWYQIDLLRGEMKRQWDKLTKDQRKRLEAALPLPPEDFEIYRVNAAIARAKGFKEAVEMPIKSGEDLYRDLIVAFGSMEKASKFMLSAGIDGIKYPSGSLSGIDDSDKYNYVVFDDKEITIKKILNSRGGFIDLNSKVSLAPVMAMLKNIPAETEAAIARLHLLGLAAYQEGKQTWSSFNARMKEVLGSLWNKFKDLMGMIYTQVKAWNDRLGEEGAITFGEGENPEFSVMDYIADVATYLEQREGGMRIFSEEGFLKGLQSPDDFFTNQGFNRKELIDNLNQLIAGKREFTERQLRAIKAALGFAQELVLSEVSQSEDTFLDLTPWIEEINADLEHQVDGIIKALKIKKPTKAQILRAEKKELEAKLKEADKKLSKLQKLLKDELEAKWKLQDRMTEFKEAVKEKRTKDADAIQQKIAKLKETIAELKVSKIKELTAKMIVNHALGKSKLNDEELKMDTRTRDEFRKLVSVGREAYRTGNQEGIAETKKQLKETIARARVRSKEKQEVKKLKHRIWRLLKNTKIKKTQGIPKGKFQADAQQTFDLMRTIFKLKDAAVYEAIQEYTEKYAASNDLPSETEAQRGRLLQIRSMIPYMDSKALKELADDIQRMIDEGRMIRELEKFNWESRITAMREDALDTITGGKGIPGTLATTGLPTQKSFTEWLKQFPSNMGMHFVGWKDIMDMLSSREKTSKPYQSALVKTSSVLEQNNNEKDGIRKGITKIAQIAKRIYGFASEHEMMRHFARDTKQEVIWTGDNKWGQATDLKMSRAEARKRWMELQDPSLESTFREGMGYTDEMIAAIRNSLTPQDEAFVEAQMEFYREYWKGVNEIYSSIYGVYLPFNQFYSPIRREGIAAPEGVGFGEMMQEIPFRAAVTSGSLKHRVENLRTIQLQSDLLVLQKHLSEMEHFKAWANRMRELNGIFKNAEVRTAIKLHHGSEMLHVIDKFLADFTRGGVDRSQHLDLFDKFRGNYTRGILAIKPNILLKQLMSFPAYGENMPAHEFAAGILDFWLHPIKRVKFLKENSVMFKERGMNMERDIKTAMASKEYSFFKTKQRWLDMLMINVQIGDQGAIAVGGWALYKYARKQGKTHEEAIREFEDFTVNTQQSADLSELSHIQRMGSFAKLFSMFLSSPNQYLRKEIGAMRNLFAGRGTVKQNLKTIGIYHFLLPMLFQLASDGFTWDRKEQLRAMILGSLNGLFLIGEGIDQLIRAILGLQPFEKEVAIYSAFNDFEKFIKEAMEAILEGDMTTEEFYRATRGLGGAVGAITGLPLKQSVDLMQTTGDFVNGEYEKAMYQIMGYSPYQAQKFQEAGEWE